VTAELTRMLLDARGKLPGAVPETINAEFYAVAREFCDFTNAWYEEIDIPIVPGTLTYTFSPAADGRIKRLLNLYESTDLNKRPIAAVRMDLPGTIVLAQDPGVTATWVAKVSKVPITESGGSASMPDWLFQQYWDTFLAGILSRMHMMGGKPFSNPQMGVVQRRIFLKGMVDARVEALVGNVRGQPTWNFPAFGRGSQRRVG